MEFREVKVEEEGVVAVVQALAHAALVACGNLDFPLNVPIEIDLGRGGEEHCVVLIGGDDEPIHIAVDHTPGGSKITFIGQLAADSLQRDYFNNSDSLKYMKELDEAFGSSTSGWATFLKVEVEPLPAGGYNSFAELAIAESEAEFDKYGHGSGKEVFENRPAKLANPEPVPVSE